MTGSETQFGFPEFWPEFEGHFGPLFPALHGVEQALNGVVDRAYESVDGWQRAVLNLGRLNGEAMEELIILAANGCGPGAMKILRSILEYTVDAEYLRQNPAQFSNYSDWGDVERWRLYESLRSNAQTTYPAIGAQEIARARQAYDSASQRFKGGGGSRRDRWCGLNLRDQAVQAGLGSLYGQVNRLASQFLHGGMFGLVLRFEPKTDIHRIDVPPSAKWCREALSGGHYCLVQTVRTVAQALSAQPEPSVEELERQRRSAWDEITRRGSAPL
ncbi:MAG: DUF5677 domain-containing protein [Terriglobales bacterium]